MKIKLSKFTLLLILISNVLTSCKDDSTPRPELNDGLNIYKTKSDYFDQVFINLNDGKVYYVPTFDGGFELKGDTPIYKYRVKLINGYILDYACPQYAAVFSYTLEEYYNMINVEKQVPSFKDLKHEIIENDPFLEYYIDKTSPPHFEMKDTADINAIIRNGELEVYFDRIK